MNASKSPPPKREGLGNRRSDLLVHELHKFRRSSPLKSLVNLPLNLTVTVERKADRNRNVSPALAFNFFDRVHAERTVAQVTSERCHLRKALPVRHAGTLCTLTNRFVRRIQLQQVVRLTLACLRSKRCEGNKVKGHRIASKLNLTEPRMVPPRFLKALDCESAQLDVFIDDVEQTLSQQRIDDRQRLAIREAEVVPERGEVDYPTDT